MAKKAVAKKAAASKVTPFQAVRADVEVEAGIFTMPFTIEEEGAAPYHPEMLIWMAVDGPVLGHEVDRPGALLERAGPLLRAALREMPFLPGTLRVESPELAALLRPQISSRVELVCAPTPALGEMLELMQSRMMPRFSYLAGGADPEVVGTFCRAAGRMLRARPWTAIPKDLVVGVTIEALGMHQNALTLYAPSRDSRGGFILAEDLDELELFGEQVERRDAGKAAEFPPLKTLVFETREEMPARLLEEIRSHGWEMGESCPWIATTTPDGGLATPKDEEFAVGTAICEVLAEAMADAGALKRAMSGKGPPVVVKTRVLLFGEEEVEVTLEAPYAERAFRNPRPEHPLLGALYDLEAEEIPDYARRKALEAELLAQFSTTRAGGKFARLEHLPLVLDIAADHLGSTAASLDGRRLEAILFGIFPRSVILDPAEIKKVVAECLAFFRFLRDDCGHDLGVADWLATPHLTKDLRAAMAKSGNGSLGKQLLAAGAKAGFDLTTSEGLGSWVAELKEKGLPLELQSAFAFFDGEIPQMVERQPDPPDREE